MPVIQTFGGCFRSAIRSGLTIKSTMPGRLPIANVIALIWKGGTFPDAAVIRASNDHIRIAVKPINVPRIFTPAPLGARTGALVSRHT